LPFGSSIGLMEIVVILVVALIIFGPAKLPEMGRSIGRGIREFRHAFSDMGKAFSLEEEEDTGEKKQAAAETAPVSKQPAKGGRLE
jgi:sec-independent protein translocase protein TatA